MFKNNVLYAPDGASGSPSDDEQTLEQLQKQATEYRKKYESLQNKIEKGELVDPLAFIEEKVKKGELYTKERFSGLQTKYQTTQEALDELNTKSQKWQSDLSQLGELVKTKDTERESLDVELETLRRSQKRTKLILSDFPELAPFEADGLLPEAEEEKLPEVFSAFATKLNGLKDKTTKEFVKGGTSGEPSSKEEKKAVTPQAILKEANAALAGGDSKTYNEKYDLYLDALNKQQNI